MHPHVVIPAPAQLKPFCEEHQIVKVAVFGSALREDFSPNSDVDVLVKFDRDKRLSVLDIVDVPVGLLPYFGGREIDLFMIRTLSRYIRNRVLTEAELIYPYSAAARQPPLAVDDDTPLREMCDETRRTMRICESHKRDDLNANRYFHDLLCHAAARVGLRAARVTEARRRELPGIDFEALIDLSEFLHREHYKIDRHRLWDVVRSSFPALVHQIEAFLPPFEEPEPSDALLSW